MNTMNSIDQLDKTEQDTAENVIAIVLSFMENAVNDAGIYVEHSGRKVVSKKDIKMALQAETFEYIHREDIEGSLLYYKESIHNDIAMYNEDDEDYEDEDNEDEDEKETFLQSKVVNDEDMEEYKVSMCRCNVCKRLNHAVLIWDDWEPETDMEKVLKKVIDTKM